VVEWRVAGLGGQRTDGMPARAIADRRGLDLMWQLAHQSESGAEYVEGREDPALSLQGKRRHERGGT
jgi:hypothetical protein